MSTEQPMLPALLVVPRLRIQNANAISSPLTWGFPSISAFVGCMHALERKVRSSTGLEFRKVGVVCHHFEAQATRGGFTRSFHLTRNPVDKDGGSAAIVEEGRIHLEVSLVFDVRVSIDHVSDAQRRMLVGQVAQALAGMRVAGGSVMPSAFVSGPQPRRLAQPSLDLLHDDVEERIKAFRRLSRRLLPGFALVSRDDLLQARLAEMRQADGSASVLDAWLSLSRLTHRARRVVAQNKATGEPVETFEWTAERPKGWIVPIPVGYSALSALHAPGEVARARDGVTPFRFVESAYSVGQWVSPHRLAEPADMLWFNEHDEASGQYRCVNEYRPAVPVSAVSPSASAVHPI